MRGMGSENGISLLRSSFNSPEKNREVLETSMLSHRLSYRRDVQADNFNPANTPSQNLIQKLLNEYLPLSHNRDQPRYSSPRGSISRYRHSSPYYGEANNRRRLFSTQERSDISRNGYDYTPRSRSRSPLQFNDLSPGVLR